MKNKPSLKNLEDRENLWITSMGSWIPGGHIIYRNINLHKEPYEKSWMKLLLYGITGRTFTKNQVELFESIWVISTSYPEPRIWNNRVSALAGTARTTGALGLSAAIATSEAIIYGYQPLQASIVFLLEIHHQLQQGHCLDTLLNEKIKLGKRKKSGKPGFGYNRKVATIPGYGRPLVNKDERINPLIKVAKSLELDSGPITKLAFDVEKALLKNGHDLNMNISPVIAGLAADQGLSAREFYYYMLLCFSAGIIPCYIDSLSKPEGEFFPIRCSNVAYRGKLRRKWKPK